MVASKLHFPKFQIESILVNIRYRSVNRNELKKTLSDRLENSFVEYKREISDSSKFARSIASIANSTGGKVYIGVEEGNKDKPVIRGVAYDAETHNKNRIINILTDRITPKIPGLEIETVLVNKRKNLFVFLLFIPPSRIVHGVKDNGHWIYYVRRPGRVDELEPSELLELCKLKSNYLDNAKTRMSLLETSRAIKEDFRRYLGLQTQNNLRACLENEELFKSTIKKAKMRNVTQNFVEAFYDLRVNLQYSLRIPHGALSVEEREIVRKIEEDIKTHAPEVQNDSGTIVLSIDSARQFTDLSLAEWIKFAMMHIEASRRNELWNMIRSHLSSYEVTFESFLTELCANQIRFDQYYEDQFCKSLRRALKSTTCDLDKLINCLEALQAKFGNFG